MSTALKQVIRAPTVLARKLSRGMPWATVETLLTEYITEHKDVTVCVQTDWDDPAQAWEYRWSNQYVARTRVAIGKYGFVFNGMYSVLQETTIMAATMAAERHVLSLFRRGEIRGGRPGELRLTVDMQTIRELTSDGTWANVERV